LYVPDTTYITISYLDESTDETVIEQCLTYPYSMTESVSLNFDMSNYYGVKDKAQINFNDNGLVSGYIHVNDKDTVYATYVSERGKKYVAKAVWESEF